MNTDEILLQIDAEIQRLTQARDLIAGAAGIARRGLHRTAAPLSSRPVPARGRRTISAEGRRRIAEAQKRRWAKQKRGKDSA